MNRLNHIEQIYDRHSQGLYATSLRIVGNSMDAEEIMQDTIIKYHHYPHKEEIENLPGWLKSVCIRKSLDKLREKHHTREFLEEYREQTPPQPPPQMQYTVEDVKKALLLLPDNYRTILSLHLFEGYDYQEIEQITGTKETTLRSLYSRAKEKLAAAIYKAKQQQDGQFGKIHK
jgi:RNA polymerase sigma-70 factor (ECF subfamily)